MIRIKKRKKKDKIKDENELFKELLNKIKKGDNPGNKDILNDLLMMDEFSFKQKRDEYLSQQKILTKKKKKE